MKHPILTMFLWLFCLACMAFAEKVTLVWDANDPVERVATYTLVYGPTPETMDKESVTDGVTVALDLPPGNWHFAVYATNVDGVNGPLCESISYQVLLPAPSAPKMLRIPQKKVEASNNKKAKKWDAIATFPVPLDKYGNERYAYYRIGS